MFASRTDLAAHVREHAVQHAWALLQRRFAPHDFFTTQGSVTPAHKVEPRQGALAPGLGSKYRYVHGPLRTSTGIEDCGSGVTIIPASTGMSTPMSAMSVLV